MKVKATITGDLKAILEKEGILAAAAIRRGMEAAGREVQQELRAQVGAAGFRSSKGLSNAWRMKVYPRGGIATLRPSALIYTQAPDIIDAFEQGKPITVRRAKYLAWPTGLNAALGRRSAGGRGGVRVTPAEMVAGKALVLNTKRPGLKLWCLKVSSAQNPTKTGRKCKLRLYVRGQAVEILTGRIKAGERKKRIETLLSQGYAAMFFLSKQTNPRKRLDVAGVFGRAGGVLEANLRAALAA